MSQTRAEDRIPPLRCIQEMLKHISKKSHCSELDQRFSGSDSGSTDKVPMWALFSKDQSGLVQVGLLRFEAFIFAFPLSKVVDGTKRTGPYHPVSSSPFTLGSTLYLSLSIYVLRYPGHCSGTKRWR